MLFIEKNLFLLCECDMNCEYDKQLYHQSVPERRARSEELLMIHTEFYNYDSACISNSTGAIKLVNQALSYIRMFGLKEFFLNVITCCRRDSEI